MPNQTIILGEQELRSRVEEISPTEKEEFTEEVFHLAMFVHVSFRGARDSRINFIETRKANREPISDET